MTGYGGFGISSQPYYNTAIGKLWLERGGVSVVANIRGGGEFGTRWHEAGRREKKRLSHDDFAAVAAEIAVQQINHGPQMPPLFDVHLKNISQIVERRAAHAQQPLLFHGSWLGVSLSHDHAPQRRAIFARNFLPRGLALMYTEIHLPVAIAWLQKYSPAIFRHAHVAKLRPAVRFDARRRAQIHFQRVAFAGAHVVPPVHIRRLPMFQRALQDPVPSQVDVVRNFFGVIDHARLLIPKL